MIGKLWAKLLLWLFVALNRNVPIPPKYSARDMRSVVRQVFGEKSRYIEQVHTDPERPEGDEHGRREFGTLATVFADGYMPMSFWWSNGNERNGRLKVATTIRSWWFRAKNRYRGARK